MIHRHDYEMVFAERGLNAVYRCRCGDTVVSMDEALKKQGSVRMDVCLMITVIAVATLLVVGAVWISRP